MGLLSRKKADAIGDFNSPALDKVNEFHAKKVHLAADFEKNQARVKELTEQLNAIREKYSNSYSDEDLKLLMATETELTALKNVVKTQQNVISKGDKREYILSEEEKQSLKESFAPIRKKRDEITQKLTDQLAEVEKTLDELEEENKIVYEAWAKIWGQVIAASQENWMIGNDLNRQREASVAQYKLGQLQDHKALDIHIWHR